MSMLCAASRSTKREARLARRSAGSAGHGALCRVVALLVVCGGLVLGAGCEDDEPEAPAPTTDGGAQPADAGQRDGAVVSDAAADGGADGASDGAADSATDQGPPADATPTSDGADTAAADLGSDPLAVPVSEQWTVPGLQAEVHVLRDAYGIPHIFGAQQVDVLRAQGFVVGRDRYFQIELMRRFGEGRLGELLGEMGLPMDQQARGQGTTDIAARLLERMGPAEQEALDAFADGFNAYIAAVQAGALPLPAELQSFGPLLGADEPATLMQPMDRAGLAGLAAVIVLELGYNSTDLLSSDIEGRLASVYGPDTPLGALRAAGLWDDIWLPVAPVHTETSAPGWGLHTELPAPAPSPRPRHPAPPSPRHPAPPRPRRAQAPRSAPEHLLQRALAGQRRLQRALGLRARSEMGSNAWAVGGGGTRHGGGLLCGDGHLPFSVPSLFYPMGLDTTALGGAEGPGSRQVGLFFPGIPLMAVGTNGHVAWSQTRFYGDITDWYAEQVQLDAEGRPAASRFDGQWRPLLRTDDSYTVADVPALGSVGRTETWPRWSTFDGRHLVALEGRAAAPGDPLGPGEALVSVGGELVVPGDTDGDGHIGAISFDYTGFDLGNLFGVLGGFGRASDLQELREHTRSLVAYGQNIVAADRQGQVFYGAYNATPCRGYLPRDADGGWLPGANPQRVLDGTLYGGFEVLFDEDGRVDESASGDSQRCVVPFDEWPEVLAAGAVWVADANNDPGNISLDDSLSDDPWYIGGPWAVGYRAHTIQTELRRLAIAGEADVDSMMRLQADHRSPLALQLLPWLLETLAEAQQVAAAGDAAPGSPEQRLALLWSGDVEGLTEAGSRLQEWLERGAVAESGVQTFYDQPDPTRRRDAVATMLFNAWLRKLLLTLFGDEGFDYLWAADPRDLRARALTALVEGRGPGNPGGLASWNPDTRESAFFDVLGTPEVETSAEVALSALRQTLVSLRAPEDEPGQGGFGTHEMDAWLWGLRHGVELPALLAAFGGSSPLIDLIAGPFSLTPTVLPLAEDLHRGDPRRGLPGFPRPGDWFAVDAANPAAEDLGHYRYAVGPVMRMVIALGPDGVDGVNVVPGGQAARPGDPHFADQAALWLGNRALPLRYDPAEAVAAARRHIVYRPE